jgi:pimeloyl-ACP methyl ester carboxylesterase
MATNFANSGLVTRLGSDRLLLWGTSAAALAGIVLVVAAWINWGGLAGAKDATGETIADCGHFLPQEDPEAVVRHVQALHERVARQ